MRSQIENRKEKKSYDKNRIARKQTGIMAGRLGQGSARAQPEHAGQRRSIDAGPATPLAGDTPGLRERNPLERLLPIDETCDDSGAVAVVNIDDGHIRRTTVQHR